MIVFAGKLADRFSPNMPVSAGLFLLAWTIIGRIGLGFVLSALNLGAMRGIDSGLIAQGASTINFLRQLGGALGVGLVGVVLEWRLAARAGEAATEGATRAFNETFLLVMLFCGAAIWAAWRMQEAEAPVDQRER